MAKFVPAKPLVNTIGSILLTDTEIEAINAWLDDHKRRLRYLRQGTAHFHVSGDEDKGEAIVADVLSRLLGHRLNLLQPAPHREG